MSAFKAGDRVRYVGRRFQAGGPPATETLTVTWADDASDWYEVERASGGLYAARGYELEAAES